MSESLKRPLLVLAVLFGTLSWAGSSQAAVYGGIEIGAKGVKAVAVEITSSAEGWDVKVLMSATQNTTLTADLAATKQFSPKALAATAEAVAKFSEQMQKDHKIAAENIHVVGSSGLFSALGGEKDAIASNRQALAAAVRSACGRTLAFVDARREAELSIDGAVPANHAAVASLLDIGGGNTKGGFRSGDKQYVTFEIPFGSVTFTDLISKRFGKEGFVTGVATARREVLDPALQKAVEGKAGLTSRERIYLSGGAVWACATFIRPGDRGNYVALTVADIDDYQKMLIKAAGSYPAPDLSTIADPKVQEAARKELAQVKKVFTPQQLLAGSEILKALAKTFEFGSNKTVRFSRHAYLGWILAYVVEKSK